MAIDSMGWTQRPSPVQHDGRRQQRPRPKLKPRGDKRSEDKPPEKDSGHRPGGIDEVV